MPDREMLALRDEIAALSTQEKLRLAASLIESGRLRLAESVVITAMAELIATRGLK